MEKKIIQLKNEFKDHNNDIKDVLVKINPEEGSSSCAAKGTTITNTSTRPKSKRSKTTDRKRIPEKKNCKKRMIAS